MMRAGLKSFASRRSFATVRDKLNELGSQMPQGGPPTGLVSAVAGISAVGFLGYNSVFTVQGGQRAVLWSRISGVKDASLTGSKDLQMVNITLRVLSKPNTSELAWIYKRLGHDYDDRVLPSIVNEVTKAVVACYNASELLTKREQVSNEIRHRLVVRAADFRIILDDVAQQDSERARYIVEKAIQEKKSIIVKAEGEAQSARLIGKAIQNNPGFVKLRKIDTAKEIAGTVARSQGKVDLNADSLLINILGNEQLGEDTSAKKRGWFR
ncbi:hypothetical protein JL720_10928 [Aureococcus anophagefferens]|nr:hypothetical protein JL720_10928 [Aureococcus anophagefferens]